jgi:DNA-binding Xre family transcriptional regulator
MNDFLVSIIKASGMSKYHLSRHSGVPYSTLNDLFLGKTDVNRCSAETIERIASALSVSISDILNPYNVMEGCSLKYRRINFHFAYTKTATVIRFRRKGKDVELSLNRLCDKPSSRELYFEFAKSRIDDYLFMESLNR